MFDILSAIYHDEIPPQHVFCNLDEPQTPEEKKIVTQLRVVNEEVAEAFKSSIEALSDKQAEKGFYCGVRFGAQLMEQLMADLS